MGCASVDWSALRLSVRSGALIDIHSNVLDALRRSQVPAVMRMCERLDAWNAAVSSSIISSSSSSGGGGGAEDAVADDHSLSVARMRREWGAFVRANRAIIDAAVRAAMQDASASGAHCDAVDGASAAGDVCTDAEASARSDAPAKRAAVDVAQRFLQVNQPRSLVIAESSGVVCPLVRRTKVFEPCELSELVPLVEHLASEPNSVAECGVVFRRGMLQADGRLDLCKQAIGPGGTQVVVDALLEHQSFVDHVLLGTNGMGDDGARHVARLVEANRVKTVYLGCNGIEAPGVAALCDALRTSTSVTSLWLKRNPVGPDGARQLAGMLRANSTLTAVDLVNTGIGVDGLAVLAAELAQRTAPLDFLFLGGNVFGAGVGRALAPLLRSEQCPRFLSLAVCDIDGDRGVASLATALRDARHLNELHLDAVGMTQAGFGGLLGALHAAGCVERLSVRGRAKSMHALGGRVNDLRGVDPAAFGGFLAGDKSLRMIDTRDTEAPLELGAAIRNALRSGANKTFCEWRHAIPNGLKRALRPLLQSNAAASGYVAYDTADVIRHIKSVFREAPPSQKPTAAASVAAGAPGSTADAGARAGLVV